MPCNPSHKNASDPKYTCDTKTDTWKIKPGFKKCNMKSPKATDDRYVCNPMTGRWNLKSRGTVKQPPKAPPKPASAQVAKLSKLSKLKKLSKRPVPPIPKPRPEDCPVFDIFKVVYPKKNDNDIMREIDKVIKLPDGKQFSASSIIIFNWYSETFNMEANEDWKLSRRRLGKLLLLMHPDKNKGCEDIATIMTKSVNRIRETMANVIKKL